MRPDRTCRFWPNWLLREPRRHAQNGFQTSTLAHSGHSTSYLNAASQYEIPDILELEIVAAGDGVCSDISVAQHGRVRRD